MSLFDPPAPDGFQYRDDFITAAEEAQLIGELAQVEFSNFEMRGVVARRRVAFFGGSYDEATAARPIPDFLRPLMYRAAAWAGVDPEALAMALINEYPVGAPIGWHRDAPQYDLVIGISLLSSARMRFRPYVSPAAQGALAARRKTTHEVLLGPRSAYQLTGKSRSEYEHSIPQVSAPRYSITFRTLRTGRAPGTERARSSSGLNPAQRD